MKDYYKILGIERGATVEEIKRAYRLLAHKYHPDKPGGNEEKFKEINEAYQILSDSAKRSQYDRFGAADASGGAGFNWADFSGGMGSGGFGDMGDLGDVFESFFEGLGVRPKRRTYERGADLEMEEKIAIEEAFRGVAKTLHVKTLVQCKSCGGKGAEADAGFSKCTVCAGRGEIQEQRRTFFGSFAQVRTCPTCHGKGEVPVKACRACNGSGRIPEMRDVSVDIIPGIQDGQLIKVKGAGEAGERGMPSGDLYVRVRVKPHPLFERRGDDLVVEKEINVFDILLGRKIEIPTVGGEKMKVAIPDRFNIKEELRIRAEGMPHLGAMGRGDLYVSLILKTPKKLSEQERKALEEIENKIK